MTWEDVRSIVNIADAIFDDGEWNYDTEQEYYEEVLRRWQQEMNGAGKTAARNRSQTKHSIPNEEGKKENRP